MHHRVLRRAQKALKMEKRHVAANFAFPTPHLIRRHQHLLLRSRRLARLLSCGEMASTTTVTTTTTKRYHRYSLNDDFRRRRKGQKGPPKRAKVGRVLGAKVVSSATKKNCDVNDVDVFLEDEDEWTKEDANDKKEDREGESGSIGGDDATKTKRSTTRGRTTTTTTTRTEAVEEVKEEAKDEYDNLTWEEIIERE